ncbi:SPIN4-like protein [Mya arenaria]|uniref:SPIN4-like protein n=1 Tax=Mya arenaria TaxID=6604 RepID=A0ABY7DUK5_MYAAR|nr:SPIN4-like protein [Mya arenaria]
MFSHFRVRWPNPTLHVQSGAGIRLMSAYDSDRDLFADTPLSQRSTQSPEVSGDTHWSHHSTQSPEVSSYTVSSQGPTQSPVSFIDLLSSQRSTQSPVGFIDLLSSQHSTQSPVGFIDLLSSQHLTQSPEVFSETPPSQRSTQPPSQWTSSDDDYVPSPVFQAKRRRVDELEVIKPVVLHKLVPVISDLNICFFLSLLNAGREAPILDPTFKNSAEPGTVRLVRTACKAFSKGGDEKNGQYLTFQTYSKDFLRENGFRGVPLERFRGNRFNILFRNAAALFFLKDKLQSYLSIEHSNRLLASVHHDIKSQIPLWCVIESENIHIIEAQTLYQELVKYLEELPQNIASFMNGTYLLSFANREKLQTSKISIALFNEWEYDGQVQIILMIIVPALCELCKRLFKDFLPEGLWFNAPGAVEDKTRSAPKHNKFSETIFGHMDRLLREKPNKKKRKKDVKHLRRAFKQRNAQIETERRRILAEKREKAEQAEQNRIKKREDITDNVQLWGLWQTEQEVDSSLSRIKTKTEQVSALKAQLNFRKTKCEDKSVYRMSKKVDNKNVPLSVEELTLNVKKLVRKAYEVDVVANPDEQVLVGRKIDHAFMTDGERTWYIGKAPGFPSWFNVKYSGDQAIYSYRLLDDLKSGELKLIQNVISPEDSCFHFPTALDAAMFEVAMHVVK